MKLDYTGVKMKGQAQKVKSQLKQLKRS